MIIHDPITCKRIQMILPLADRACLFLQSIHLQPIYLSTYKGKCYRGGGFSILEFWVLPARGIEIIENPEILAGTTFDGFVKSRHSGENRSPDN